MLVESPAPGTSGAPSPDGIGDDPFDSESDGEDGGIEKGGDIQRAPLRRGGTYVPRPLAEVVLDMNIPPVRDAGKAVGTLKQYAAEVDRFETFAQYACARNLRKMVGEAAAYDFITKQGNIFPPAGRAVGPAVVNMRKLYASPPRGCDELVHAFMADRSDGWSCSEGKMKKIVAALSRKFHDEGSKGPWNGVLGNPVDSPVVKEVRSNHVEKRRRAATAVKGVDPIKFKDLDQFYEAHFAGKPLRQWDPERVLLYTSLLTGMNICVRFNELSRFWYVPPLFSCYFLSSINVVTCVQLTLCLYSSSARLVSSSSAAMCPGPILSVCALSVDSMEIEDDRVRLILVGTKAEKGATVRFNVMRWPGTLAGDLRYVCFLTAEGNVCAQVSTIISVRRNAVTCRPSCRTKMTYSR